VRTDAETDEQTPPKTIPAHSWRAVRRERAQTCALPLFCDRDLEINPMTLKLEGDLEPRYSKEDVEEEEENLFTKKAGCQKGLQPINAGWLS